jgi:hypothetical protein
MRAQGSALLEVVRIAGQEHADPRLREPGVQPDTLTARSDDSCVGQAIPTQGQPRGAVRVLAPSTGLPSSEIGLWGYATRNCDSQRAASATSGRWAVRTGSAGAP